MLDAGVSASMITEQEVLTDQEHKGGDAREWTETSENEAQGRFDRDAWRARQGAGSRKWQPRERRARQQRQTASISREQEHASNDVRSQDAEQCVESDARYLLFVTFAATTLSVILMTRARVDCQSSEDRYNAVCW